jgi:hypothetical protein
VAKPINLKMQNGGQREELGRKSPPAPKMKEGKSVKGLRRRKIM